MHSIAFFLNFSFSLFQTLRFSYSLMARVVNYSLFTRVGAVCLFTGLKTLQPANVVVRMEFMYTDSLLLLMSSERPLSVVFEFIFELRVDCIRIISYYITVSLLAIQSYTHTYSLANPFNSKHANMN